MRPHRWPEKLWARKRQKQANHQQRMLRLYPLSPVLKGLIRFPMTSYDIIFLFMLKSSRVSYLDALADEPIKLGIREPNSCRSSTNHLRCTTMNHERILSVFQLCDPQAETSWTELVVVTWCVTAKKSYDNPNFWVQNDNSAGHVDYRAGMWPPRLYDFQTVQKASCVP